jgi:hypothetical protein
MKHSENKQFRSLLHKNIHIKKDVTDKLLIADFEIRQTGTTKNRFERTNDRRLISNTFTAAP